MQDTEKGRWPGVGRGATGAGDRTGGERGVGCVRAGIERVDHGGKGRVGRLGLNMSPLPYEAEGRMGALTVTASAARLGARLRDGDPLEDMGMFTE